MDRSAAGEIMVSERATSAHDVAAGSLREVLPGTLPATRKIYALYLPSRYLPPQVRAFIDLLVRRQGLPGQQELPIRA
jgi:DNA-binding transcriptional LysR family regulator